MTKGRTFYDPTSQSYKIVGAGQYSDLNREDLHFHFRKMGGDFLLTADFSFANDNGLQMKKMGWMVRESLRDDAAHIAAVRQGDEVVGAKEEKTAAAEPSPAGTAAPRPKPWHGAA